MILAQYTSLEGWQAGHVEVLDRRSGVAGLRRAASLKKDIQQLAPNASASIFATTSNELLTRLLAPAEVLGPILQNITLRTPFPAQSNPLSGQLQQVAKLIHARQRLGAERDVFFVQLPSFDTHDDQGGVLAELFGHLDAALAAFASELRAEGVWDEVVVQSASEFGRTLVTNGRGGTDHGWGGVHFTMGGSIDGGKILGHFPRSLSVSGPHSVGPSGRLIPTTPWEGIWRPLAEWFGVDKTRLAQLLPNLPNFSEAALLRKTDLFRR